MVAKLLLFSLSKPQGVVKLFTYSNHLPLNTKIEKKMKIQEKKSQAPLHYFCTNKIYILTQNE